jgi:hypothetical protein
MIQGNNASCEHENRITANNSRYALIVFNLYERTGIRNKVCSLKKNTVPMEINMLLHSKHVDMMYTGAVQEYIG